MNIQFMTEKNAKIIKDPWTGENKTVYVPDFEELVKNASCQEEIDAIRETEATLNNKKAASKDSFSRLYIWYMQKRWYTTARLVSRNGLRSGRCASILGLEVTMEYIRQKKK